MIKAFENGEDEADVHTQHLPSAMLGPLCAVGHIIFTATPRGK